jgi:F-type H+-transporting ATPase subunit delta
MSNNRVAGRYSKGLMDLAIEQGQLETVYADMQFLQQVCKTSRDFVVMLKSPVVNIEKKQAVLDSITAGRISELTASFNRLLIRKGRETELPDMIDVFISMYKKHKQIHVVHLTSATPLSEASKTAIIDKLKKDVNLEHIELNTSVDPELIGGFVLQVGDSLVDTSIASELKAIKKQFQNNDYIFKVR